MTHPLPRPQDDLYRHVNGEWLDTHEIPADRPVDGAFHALRDLSEERCRQICEDVAAGQLDDPDSPRLAALWNAFMDVDSIEAAGVSPLTSELNLVHSAHTHDELAYVVGRLQRSGVSGLISLWVGTDPHDPDSPMLALTQGGLGLPDEAYYRETPHESVRAAYVVMLARLFALATGIGEATAEKQAERVLALETSFASHHRDAVSNRDPLARDNPCPWGELPQRFPGWNWAQWARGLGIDLTETQVVTLHQPEFLDGALSQWATTDIEDLQLWLLACLLDARAGLLSQDFQDVHFDFHGRALAGTNELRPRWKRALSLIEDLLGDALGRIWVSRHFPETAKERMDSLVAALLEAYAESIRELDWMGEKTKERALEKLALFTPKIGHPDKWKSYDSWEVSPCDDLVDLVRKGCEAATEREFAKLGHPVDRSEWFMSPQTVNAYYNPQMNEIVFPAAILQPPFFNVDADEATNFGAIGAVIGHEIGHGFDDQGSRWDGNGALENWWDDEDRRRFEERTGALIAQYDGLVPADLQHAGHEDVHVNGALTIGENIGDLGGLTIAWKACTRVLASRGITADHEVARTFFLSWARVWRTKTRLEFARQLLAIDPHSPAEFRCNQVVANMDAFAHAWDLTPSDKLWIEPAQRVRIW